MFFTPGVLVSFCCITSYHSLNGTQESALSPGQISVDQLMFAYAGRRFGSNLLRPRVENGHILLITEVRSSQNVASGM